MISSKMRTVILATLSLIGAVLYVVQFWPIGALLLEEKKSGNEWSTTTATTTNQP